MAVTAVITSIDFVLVVFRLVWRSMVQGAVGMDDIFVGLAMVSSSVPLHHCLVLTKCAV